MRLRLLISLLVALLLAPGVLRAVPAHGATGAQTAVSIQGTSFLINSQTTSLGLPAEGLLMNSRMVMGIFDDENPATVGNWAYPDTHVWDPQRNTNEFVAALPSYAQHGVRMLTVGLQGGCPLHTVAQPHCASNMPQPWIVSAFNADGSLKAAWMTRLNQVIRAADANGMVVIVSFFDKVQNLLVTNQVDAVNNITDWLVNGSYTNVLVETANECDVGSYSTYLFCGNEATVIKQVQTRSAGKLKVSVSYGGGRVPDADVVTQSDFVLLHGNSQTASGVTAMINSVRAMPAYQAAPKPIVINEDSTSLDNLNAAVAGKTSWGYLDTGFNNYQDGFQSPPVNWSINTDLKTAFFNRSQAVAMTVWSAGYAGASTPTAWASNQTQTYTVTVTNTGNQPWPGAGSNPVHLAVRFTKAGGGDGNNIFYTDQRFSLPADLAPGASVILTIAVTAPSAQSGSLVLEYQMVKEYQFWFGQFTDLAVQVTPAWAATYNAATTPTAWASSQTQTYAVTVSNTGSQSWPAAGSNPVHLAVRFTNAGGGVGNNTSYTDQRFSLPADLAPGASVLVTVAVTAPSAQSGSLTLEYQMVKEMQFWFSQFADFAVQVTPPWAATYIVATTPTTWASSQTQTYAVTVTNTGNQIWPAAGSNPVHIAVRFTKAGGGAGNNIFYTDQRISLPADLTPGASVVLTIAVIAPSAQSGSLMLEYQMVKEMQFWFSQFSDIAVQVTPPWAATYTVASTPTTWATSQTQTYSITVTNTGGQPWPAAGSNPVHLGLRFTNAGGGYGNNTSYTDQRFSLPADLAPGASVVLTIGVTAPSAQNGSLMLEYQMVKEMQFWFSQFSDVSTFVYSQAPQGSWLGNYGTDGYGLLAWNGGSDVTALPQSQLIVDQGTRYNGWSGGAGTSDVRALQSPDGSTRRATCIYDPDQVRLHLVFSSAYSGVLHLYQVDWDSTSRRQSVTVDDGSGPRTAYLNSLFDQGAWVNAPIAVASGGSVTVTIKRTGANNVVLSGLFLGPAGLAYSQAPQGSWLGNYGTDGYDLLAWNGGSDLAALPQSQLVVDRGTRYNGWIGGAGTSDVRALQSPDGSTRRATCIYDPDQVRLHLTFSSAYSGVLHLYQVDWDSTSRRQSVTVDDGSGPRTAYLNSPFDQGVWVNAPIAVASGGSVTVAIKRTGTNNVVLSGLFLN